MLIGLGTDFVDSLFGSGDGGNGVVPAPADIPLALAGSGSIPLAAGYSAGTGEPLPESQGQSSTSCLSLSNAATDAVNYKLDQQPFTMKKGYSQSLTAGKTWTVEFDRGGNGGVARYNISHGAYKFVQGEQGWELFQKSSKITLDNQDNRFDFNYVLNDKAQSVSAGQSQEFDSSCPLVIRFDDSQGQIKQKRLESGKYQVAIGANNTVDLFPDDAVTRPTMVAISAPASASKKGLTLASARGSEVLPAPEPPSEPASLDKPGAAPTKMTPRVKRLPPGFKLSTPSLLASATKARADTRPEESKTNVSPSSEKLPDAKSVKP